MSPVEHAGLQWQRGERDQRARASCRVRIHVGHFLTLSVGLSKRIDLILGGYSHPFQQSGGNISPQQEVFAVGIP
jgi:hypothetical protein